MTAIQSVSVNPESLRGASFAEERHGYARGEVHALLEAAADALEVAWRENEALTCRTNAMPARLRKTASQTSASSPWPAYGPTIFDGW